MDKHVDDLYYVIVVDFFTCMKRKRKTEPQFYLVIKAEKAFFSQSPDEQIEGKKILLTKAISKKLIGKSAQFAEKNGDGWLVDTEIMNILGVDDTKQLIAHLHV